MSDRSDSIKYDSPRCCGLWNSSTCTAVRFGTIASGNAVIGCAVKGGGPQRELDPPGNWFAPPGSNQSSSGGNETAEASGAEGRKGDLASMQAVT